LLGSKDDGNSPTFSLINNYITQSGETIYHMDLYRLNSPEEALDIGVEEIIQSNCWCFIEWPEYVLPFLDQYALLEITVENEVRKYSLTTPG
jgi:tRNA threonylcarbamoyladenosine biosynthesis protein TsaE